MTILSTGMMWGQQNWKYLEKPGVENKKPGEENTSYLRLRFDINKEM
jgi:hypothetical protein